MKLVIRLDRRRLVSRVDAVVSIPDERRRADQPALQGGNPARVRALIGLPHFARG